MILHFHVYFNIWLFVPDKVTSVETPKNNNMTLGWVQKGTKIPQKSIQNEKESDLFLSIQTLEYGMIGGPVSLPMYFWFVCEDAESLNNVSSRCEP